MEASGFQVAGIQVGAWNGNSGFRNVRITNSRLHGNIRNGLTIWGYSANGHTGYSNEKVYIGNVHAYRNHGISGVSAPTGNGIVISSTNGGVIERSLAYENGANNTSKSGPVGIWAWHSNNIRIQFNRAFNNRTALGAGDGGGFDLDGGVSNSVMQYNYSRGNDGAGFLIAQYAKATLPNYRNTIRYNISENDGRKNNYAGIFVWSGDGTSRGVENLQIYNNSIYITPTPSGNPAGLYIVSPTTNIKIRNNIIVTKGSVPLMNIVAGQSGLAIQGNSYWSMGFAFRILHAGKLYSRLADFRAATGMEKIGTQATGFNVDPKFTALGAGGFKLQNSSPLINRGIDLKSVFGIPMGGRDYFGTPIPQGGAIDVGAHEYAPLGRSY